MASERHNASLDGLRGVAAAAVVWYHLTGQGFGVGLPHRGYLAVDFFFILSGLVVARAYEARLQSGLSLLDFTKIRLIRLYPLILLGVFCGAALRLSALHFAPQPGVGLGTILLAIPFGLLLLPYAQAHLSYGEIFPLDGPLWSLMFELWANLFYAYIARHAIRRLPMLTWIAISAGAIILLARCLAGFNLDAGHKLPSFFIGVARVSYGFFLGVALHRILTPARLARLPSVPFPVLGAGLLLTLLAGPGFGAIYDVVAVLVIFPAIVALGAVDCISRRWRNAALAAGALSYPIYVLHDATFGHLSHFLGHSAARNDAVLTAAFLAILLVSHAALRWYDEPVRNWLTRQLRRRPQLVPMPLRAGD